MLHTLIQDPARPATEEMLELSRRMAGPQRYRLLQGYPMPALMKAYPEGLEFSPLPVDTSRRLIVGVLPHASCAPEVEGCGYCTFPQESFRKSAVEKTVEAVIQELRSTPYQGRNVEALYFGGGTANLTPAKSFSRLLATVSEKFDLSESEITLEGAPAFFLSQNEVLLTLLADKVNSGSKRLSMGVQTFDEVLLGKMGRLSMGHPRQVAEAVKAAHRRSMTCSADLMINLPGQSIRDMIGDVERAAEMGFDQICVYHLVLFRGLGTPWSKSKDLLKSLPDNELAFENWQKVVARVRELGFVQKTVTNFERRGQYRYENDSFQPQSYDALGFGPAAITCLTQLSTQTAAKWINHSTNSSYTQSIAQGNSAQERLFVYGQTDLKLLYLTRTLARRSSDRAAYAQAYGSDPLLDFGPEIQACQRAGLITISPTELRLTPRGNFFADSVTGLLASRRVAEIRNGPDDSNSSGRVHMG